MSKAETLQLLYNNGLVMVPLNGKIPIVKDWPTVITQENTLDYFNKYKWNNIGIMCGIKSGIVVVEIKDVNNVIWTALASNNLDLGTFTVNTSSNGLHYYFKYDSRTEVLKNQTISINGKSINFKTNSEYVLSIYSNHVNGNIYTVKSGSKDNLFNINEMPEWLYKLLLDNQSRISNNQFNINYEISNIISDPKFNHQCLTSNLIKGLESCYYDYALNTIYNYEIKDKYLFLKRLCESHCNICTRTHNYEDGALYFDLNGNIRLWCFADRKSKIYIYHDNAVMLDTEEIIKFQPPELYCNNEKNKIYNNITINSNIENNNTLKEIPTDNTILKESTITTTVIKESSTNNTFKTKLTYIPYQQTTDISIPDKQLNKYKAAIEVFRSSGRVNDYDKWRKVGYAFFDINRKDLFEEFSKPEYSQKEIDQLWNKALTSGNANIKLITIASIDTWLKEDLGDVGYKGFMAEFNSKSKNKTTKKYEHINTNYLSKYIDHDLLDRINQTTRSDLSISKWFADNYYNVFKIKEKKTFSGYIYDESTALWCDSPYDFFTTSMADILSKEYSNLINELQNLNDNIPIEDTEAHKQYDLILKRLSTLEVKSEKAIFGRTIGCYTKMFLYKKDPDFNRKINSILHLIPVRPKLVVNLKTGEVRQRRFDDYFTFELPVDYNPNADLTFIKKFMFDFCTENQEKIDCLQTILGYCLTGETKEQKAFIFFGTGSNGKSALIKLMRRLWDPCYDVATRDTWMSGGIRNSGGPSPHLAKLFDKRISVLDEADKNSILNEGQFKLLTGGDCIESRFLNANYSTIPIYFKMLLFCNLPLPECSTDDAVWRRIIAWICETTYVEDPSQISKPIKQKLKDPNIYNEIQKEENISAFLNWLIEGAVRYYKNGLYIPKCVKDTINQYKQDNDPLIPFIEQCCDIDPNFKSKGSKSKFYVYKTDIFKNYLEWSTNPENTGIKILTPKEFHAAMTTKFGKPKMRDGYPVYKGISFKPINSKQTDLTVFL